VRVEIGGHTDNTGNAASNMRLSLARAQAVRNYFIGKGIAADRLTARGYGSTQPVANNATVAGRAENRRVELKKID
jgi:outer membrane protein OmpA-like peptidoglycan-associated protein